MTETEWAVTGAGLLVMGVIVGCWLAWSILNDRIQRAYLDGVREGQQCETEAAVQKAIVEERLALARRLHDSGRRSVARPGADPARIHRLQVGPRRPGQSTK